MSRTTLKPIISNLREEIIKSIAGKMEKFGFDNNGNIISNKPLSEYDTNIRNNLVNIFKGKGITNNRKKYIEYIQDSARTFLHILISFKTMEKRGLINKVLEELLGHEIYDDIIPDFNNVSPMAFIDLSRKHKENIKNMQVKDNDEEDIEYYNFIFMLSELSKEMAKEVPLLFKDYEYNLVHPDFDGVKAILFSINNIADEEYYEDDFLGWIYQYWVDVKESELKLAKDNKDISYAHSIYFEILNNLEQEQTQFGEFYTPRWVVKYIVDNTLKPYFEENKKIETIKLLDPACGAGNFLVYSFDVFYDLYKIEHPDWSDTKIINSILDKNIFGVDIQKEPLQITAINLWLKSKKKAKDVNIENFNLFNMNVLKANSLYRYENDPEVKAQISFFDEEIDLTEKSYTAEDIGRYITSQRYKAQRDANLFFKNRFNIIVMNPPYLGIRKMDKETSEFLKKEYPKYYNNLFEAFIARSEELLIKNGYLGFVGSDSFMTLDSHDKIRELLLISFALKKIIKLGTDVFDGPAVSAAILIGKKTNKNSRNIVECSNASKQLADKKLDDFEYTNINQKTFKNIEGLPFIFDFTSNVQAIFNNNGSIDKVIDIKQGIMTGNNDKYLRYKWEVPESEIGENWYPYVKGDGAEKFANDINFCVDWRNNGYEMKLEAKKKYGSETRTIKNQQYFFLPGIVYSRVGGNKLTARNHPKGCIFDANAPTIFLKNNDIMIEYYLGFLNSKITNYLLNKLNDTTMFQVGDLKRLPFKMPNEYDAQMIVNKVKKAIKTKEYLLGFNYISDFYHEVELQYGFNNNAETISESYEIYINKYNQLENELYNLQLEIDQIVYKIYELDEEDIKVIEEEFPNEPPKPNKENDIKKVVLSYIRAITKDVLISNPARLYTDIEIENIIKQTIEDRFKNGYKIVEEIEAILGKPIIEIIRVGVKIGSTNIPLAGKGSKDLDEPLLQQKVISGSGKNKHVILWHLSHFLLEFEEDKKYVMQNEIRRLNNSIYRPFLQKIKEKLQLEITSAEKKILEKEEKLFADSIKALENWKVVD